MIIHQIVTTYNVIFLDNSIIISLFILKLPCTSKTVNWVNSWSFDYIIWLQIIWHCNTRTRITLNILFLLLVIKIYHGCSGHLQTLSTPFLSSKTCSQTFSLIIFLFTLNIKIFPLLLLEFTSLINRKNNHL